MTWQLDYTAFQKELEAILDWKETLPELKKEFLNQLGVEMLEIVRDRIRGTGKVKSWQEYVVGKRTGYSAVRPKLATYQSSPYTATARATENAFQQKLMDQVVDWTNENGVMPAILVPGFTHGKH